MAKKLPTVAVVRLEGVIQAGSGPGSQRLVNLSRFGPVLKQAFATKPEAVALIINSPGGSPVQSSLINKRIKQLKVKHENKIPVLAFVEDVCASGGYYIAAAADEIHADESSIVGSIGVIRAGFGFQDLIAKIGVERRVQASGANKSQLDPFLPEREEDVQRILPLQTQIHNAFINVVKDGRGDRLKPEVAAAKQVAAVGPRASGGEEGDGAEGEPEESEAGVLGLFDGSFYAGPDALDIGLVDSLNDIHSVAQEKFGEDVQLVELKPRPSFGLPPFLGGSVAQQAVSALASASGVGSVGGGGDDHAAVAAFGDGIVASTVQHAEERSSWARYGL